jgi:hypothetical protein
MVAREMRTTHNHPVLWIAITAITRSINPHEVTAMASTLERLIVDY